MAEELPILIASLADEQARELEAAARVGRNVWVQLKWAPAQPGPHLLEVYVPSTNVPLRLLAEPLGSESEKGFALRLYPWEDEEPETAAPASFADVSPDQLVGRALAGGRFEILSVIGEGSIGSVYRARHTGLGIVVAVKVLHEAFQRDAEFCRRFYAEALALSRLDHPNLVHVYDFGQEEDGLLYISMAFVEGGTLRSITRREPKLDVPRIVSLMLQTCAGLGHAHTRGLIHRDVKPDNVMIVAKEDDDGNSVESVKLLDFGFAVPPSVSGEVAQRLAGTPVYMSPEQCLGEELDVRSDVYACGIMMYELATGTVPFLARDAESIRQMHVDAEPPLVSAKRPDIDPRFDRLVQKALAKSRDDRHESMKELRAELRALLVPEGARSSGSYDRTSTPSIPSIPSMPAARSVTPPKRSAPPPDWLESAQEGYARFMDDARTSTPAHAIADALVKDASSWLGDLAHERDVRALTRRLVELEGAVRILAQRADARTLKMISAVVGGLEDRVENDAQAKGAFATVTRLLVDPDVLAPIAARLLSHAEEGRDAAAAEIIADARVAGAFALYGARTKSAADPQVRIAFVKMMKSLGDSALPVVRAALERILDRAVSGAHPGAVELAEDLLLGMPTGFDEVSGHLVVKYAAGAVPNLCRAAARALPRVWAERAQPTLLRLVDHPDDGVRVAAIVGLREIGGIDAQVVERIAALVDGGRAQSQQFRAAATAALQSATASARANAAAVLERLGQ